MLPYFALAGAGLAGGALPRRAPAYRRGFLAALGLACWLTASLRCVTGFDYRSYEALFHRAAAAGLSGLLAPGLPEPGFVLLNLAAALPGGGCRAFLFLFHLLLTVLVFAWIGRFSPAPWLSAYLFVALQYFAMSMNLLRQSLAAAVILWTYPFLLRRRFLPYCAVTLLAASFHKSALLMLPLYFLLISRPSPRRLAAAAMASGAAYLLLDPLLRLLLTVLPVYRSYSGGAYWRGNSAVYLLPPLGCFLLTLPLVRRALRDPAASPVLANAAVCALPLQLLVTRHFILERLSIYPAMFSLLSLPEAVRASRRPRLWTALAVLFGLAYFLFAASQGFHGVYPYHGVWDRAAP